MIGRLTRTGRAMAVVIGIGLIPLGVGVALVERESSRNAQREADRELSGDATERALSLENYFARARSVVLISSHNPAFADFYRLPGTREEKVNRGGPVLERINQAMIYLETVYPESISEVCFIDRSGWENARVVRGERARFPDLSNELGNPFVKPTFALDHGQVYHARPYVSPDTREWVVSNSTLMPTADGSKRAIVHFEVTIESFRLQAAAGSAHDVFIVDARTGAIIADSRFRQRVGASLGNPADRRFAALAGRRGRGVLEVGGQRVAYRRLAREPGNANEWMVVVAAEPVGASMFGAIGVPLAIVAGAILLIAFAVARRWVGLSSDLDESERRYRKLFEQAEKGRQELARHNDELRSLDQLKDEFIALVSHELRTPLTSICGYVELLREGATGELSDEQQLFLDIVARNSDRLNALVNDLLFIAQLEAGKLELERSEVDLAGVVAESVAAGRPLAEGKGIALTPKTVPVLVSGDRVRLGQMLDNFVSNAIKFTPEHGRVTVRLGLARGRAVLEIADTGIGIPAGEQEHLFQRFFRTSNAQTIKGTGLGLTIAKAIAEGHGGSVSFESAEGVGTTFRIELPLSDELEQAA